MLKDKVAIVTGAGTAIGRELAKEFARNGAKVACCGRTRETLEETVNMIKSSGGQAVAIPTDVTDQAQVHSMVRETVNCLGPIDILFNNAGRFNSVGAVWNAEPDNWWQDVTVNLFGSFLCCREVLPHMMEKNSGIIINMDGGGGSTGPNLGGSAYGCSKAALLRFSEGLARELEKEGKKVMVFCMNPGFVTSEMTRNLLRTPEGEKWQAFVRELMQSPDRKEPDACAKATMQLLKIACPELNGRTFTVDTDFDKVKKERAAIKQKNLYVLRYKTE